MYVGRKLFKCNHLKSLEWRNLPTTHSIQFNLIQKTLFVPKGQFKAHGTVDINTIKKYINKY